MDEPPQPADQRPPPRSRLSSTPSWVTLGFILGALFVYLLPPSFKGAKPPPREVAAPAAAPAPKPQARTPERMTEVEAVFDVWGRYAVWDDDRTEIAMWDRHDSAYTDYYEVIRVDGKRYFRSIPSLTRRPLANAAHPECPLLFTESERMHEEWLRERSQLVPAYPAPDQPPANDDASGDARPRSSSHP